MPGDEPPFREPWEAQAFAMTVKLHEAGHFTWPEWAAVLSEEIAKIIKEPEITSRLAGLGIEPSGAGPAAARPGSRSVGPSSPWRCARAP